MKTPLSSDIGLLNSDLQQHLEAKELANEFEIIEVFTKKEPVQVRTSKAK